jgi:hypothetical protein
MNWDQLAATADEYGPFLFALLFVTSLTIIAQRAYAGATSPDQIATFRSYFFTSFYFGLLLVAVCIVFWIYDRELPHKYVYTVDINNVPATLNIQPTAGGNAEACSIPMPVPVNGYPVQRFHAIFIEDQRLRPGSHLDVVVSPSSGFGTPTNGQFKPMSVKVNSLETELDFQQLGGRAAANTPAQGPVG